MIADATNLKLRTVPWPLSVLEPKMPLAPLPGILESPSAMGSGSLWVWPALRVTRLRIYGNLLMHRVTYTKSPKITIFELP